MRIALGLEYDGSSFSGWQSQAHGNTVQDVLEEALATIAGHPLRTTCAGRTDAGVHAHEQIVHFESDAQRPMTAWVRGVNAHLPHSVVVCWAAEVKTEFHARFSARARHYRYLLLNRPMRPAIFAGKVGWCHQVLDINRMRQASGCLVGEHDFTAFRAAECQAKSPIRTMRSVVITRHHDLIAFDFVANAFLHHMIRNLVGSLVFVGMGKHDTDWVAELLASRSRHQAAPTFDAAGLYFVGVDYGPDWQLPQERRIIGPSVALWL